MPPSQRVRPSLRSKFEVGLVYSRDSKIYLAVSPSSLGRVVKSKWEVFSPRDLSNFKLEKGASTDFLCELWGVSYEKLTLMFWGGEVPLPRTYFERHIGLGEVKRAENAKTDPGPRVFSFYGSRAELYRGE